MKKSVVVLAATGLFALGCQPPPAGDSKELVERIEKLEKKVEALEKRPAAAPNRRQEPPPQTAAYKIPVGDSAVLGKKDAPVNVTIFTDYQCPFCARVDPMLHDIVKDAELKEKVNVVFKHFPLSFHKDAKPASKAALAAKEQGDDFFWKMSEKLYANQRELTAENFSKWAGEIGLNVGKFEADLKSNDARYDAMIDADMKLGTSEARVRGTPSIFVNGWELRQRSVDGVKQLIKEKSLI
ncbi:MAG: thioredoxin domain-containing protein [Myxococcota bacterium]